MRERELCLVACLLVAGPAASLRGQDAGGFIAADQWACLVPLAGSDCAGGGPGGMLANWVAPHDVALENPVEGTVWSDIAFGGDARSSGYRGAGSPAFLNIGLGSDPGTVDFDEHLASNGFTDDFVLGIAVTYVRNLTGAPLRVGLCTASDDSIQVWVNNSLALNLSACRGMVPDCSEVTPAVLAPGVNRITVLVWNGILGFGFRLALLKDDGSKYTAADSGVLQFLGAGSNAGVVAKLPVATRSYAGSDFLCAGADAAPGSARRVSIRGEAAFANGTVYRVCERLRGAVRPQDITSVSGGGAVAVLPHLTKPVNAFRSTVVGDPCSTANDLFNQGSQYTTRATTGGDIWADGDTFAFAYGYVQGDFDVSVAILDKRFPPSGRWGKFGIMARQSLEPDSRFGFIQDHGPDPQDPARYSHRTAEGTAGTVAEPATAAGLSDPVDGSSLTHPTRLRLTRSGNVFRSWVSNTVSAGNAGNDGAWVQVHADTWQNPPAAVYLGFAYSVHSSSGCATGEIDWTPLRISAVPVAEPQAADGVEICWNVTGSVLKGGLSYDVNLPRGTVVGMKGTAGSTRIAGPDAITFQSEPAAAVGQFETAHDIGEEGPCTPGSLTVAPAGGDDLYTMTASGNDIWAIGDQFHFAYRRLTGDFEVEARFSDLVPPATGGRWGKYGLMARWDCRPNSAYFFAHNAGATSTTCEIDGPRSAFRPRGGLDGGNLEPNAYWWQDVFGSEPYNASCPTDLPVDPRANILLGDARNAAPWLRLVRRGNAFYGYGSDDGVEWRSLGMYAWHEAPETVLVGAAMTSHAGCAVQRIRFDRLRYGTPPPLATEFEEGESLETLAAFDFDADVAGQCPAGWVCNVPPTRTFTPRVTADRLQVLDLRPPPAGSGAFAAATAFWPEPLALDRVYQFEFDAFFAYDPALAAGPSPVPSEGLTFTLLGIDPQVTDLESFLASHLGDAGEGLGYHRINLSLDESQLRSKDASLNSFAVELDTRHSGDVWNDGDGANVSGWDPAGGVAGTAPYHVGLDVNASTHSVQRNLHLGVHDEDLPDIYHPAGIHVRVLYDHGRIRAWVRSNAGGGELQVLDHGAEPLERNAVQALAGFTAGTFDGGLTAAIDNFEIAALAAAVEYLHGDVNRDGRVNHLDLFFLANHHFGTRPPVLPLPCQAAADTNGDGNLNLTDLAFMAGWALGDAAPRSPLLEIDTASGDLDCEEAVTPPAVDPGYRIDWTHAPVAERGRKDFEAFLSATTADPIECLSIAYRVDRRYLENVRADLAGTIFPDDLRAAFEDSNFFKVTVSASADPGHDLLRVRAIFNDEVNGFVPLDIPATSRPLAGDRLLRLLFDIKGDAPQSGAAPVLVPAVEADLDPLRPAGANEFCREFTSVLPVAVDGLTLGIGRGPVFVRGDANLSGQVSPIDATFILGYLYLGGDIPRCLDAADVDDSGNLDITDAVRLLQVLFGFAPPPPAPFPNPGEDPTTDDPLDCADETVTPPALDFDYLIDWETPAQAFQGEEGVDVYLLASSDAPLECFSIAYRVNPLAVSDVRADFADTIFPPAKRAAFESGTPFFRFKLDPDTDIFQVAAVFLEGAPPEVIVFPATQRRLQAERLLHLSIDLSPDAPTGEDILLLEPVAAEDLPPTAGVYNEFCRTVPAGAGGGAIGAGGGVLVGSQEGVVPVAEILIIANLVDGDEYLRGDGNCDGLVNIADMSAIANWLFSGATRPCCLDAANVNFDPENPESLNSTQIDIADPVFLGNFLFLGGSAPAAPFNRASICERNAIYKGCLEPCVGGIRE